MAFVRQQRAISGLKNAPSRSLFSRVILVDKVDESLAVLFFVPAQNKMVAREEWCADPLDCVI